MKFIERARSLYNSTRNVRYSSIPSIDLKDRLSAATVAAGLRSVGVLEGEGLQLELLRESLINHGIHTLISKTVCDKTRVPKEHRHFKSVEFLNDSQHDSGSRVLWICDDKEQRNQIKGARLNKKEAGLLLSYPACCVEANINGDVEYLEGFLDAIVKKVGTDEKAIRKALRDDLQVEMPEPPGMSNIPRTDAQFPFVIHIACDACLNSPASPTAILNEQYKNLASELDPQLVETTTRIGELTSQLEHATRNERSRIISQMASIHKKLLPQCP